MARVFYSMAGEGRGHATRVHAIVQALLAEHDFTLFAPGDAYEMLAPLYAGTGVRVFRIPGLHFEYTAGHRLSCWKTAVEASRYFWKFPQLARRLERTIRRERPDLVITDFEPALPHAARRCNVPFLSLDHQHFLIDSDLSSLPLWLRVIARGMGQVVRCYYEGQVETVISSFYGPPLLDRGKTVRQIGVLLRPDILGAVPQSGDYLLAYLRREMPASVLETLGRCGRTVKVYGLGERPPQGNLEFCRIHPARFVADLAACEAVVSSAGNQLVGEAQYLEKPVFGMPESGNYEQRINAHFLAQSRAGDWCDPAEFNVQSLNRFLSQRAEFVKNIDRERVNGTDAALRVIRNYLPAASKSPVSPIRHVSSPLPALAE